MFKPILRNNICRKCSHYLGVEDLEKGFCPRCNCNNFEEDYFEKKRDKNKLNK